MFLNQRNAFWKFKHSTFRQRTSLLVNTRGLMLRSFLNLAVKYSIQMNLTVTYCTPGWHFACSETVYTNSVISLEYVQNVFD